MAQKELEDETGDAPGPRCSSFLAHPIWCVLEGRTARPAPGMPRSVLIVRQHRRNRLTRWQRTKDEAPGQSPGALLLLQSDIPAGLFHERVLVVLQGFNPLGPRAFPRIHRVHLVPRTHELRLLAAHLIARAVGIRINEGLSCRSMAIGEGNATG